MGLLDVTDDPQTLGLLSLGLRLMSTPGRFGTALGQSGLGALGDMRQARAAQGQREQQAMQRKLMQAQIAENEAQAAQRRAAAEAAAQKEARLRGALAQLPDPLQAAMAGGGGPTPANAASASDPRRRASWLALQADPSNMKAWENYTAVLDPNYGRPEIAHTVDTEGPGGRPQKEFRSKYGDLVGSAVRSPLVTPTLTEMRFLQENPDLWPMFLSMNESRRPKTDIHVGEKTANEEYLKGMRVRFDNLSNAESTLQNIGKAKNLVERARTFTGPFSKWKLEAVKLINGTFGTSIAADSVASAEELQSRMFYQIMDNLKKMDAQPSQKQQEAMQAALGNLGNDANAIPRILNAYVDIIVDKVGRYNAEARDAETRGIRFPYNPIIKLDSAPTDAELMDLYGDTGAQFNIGGKQWKRGDVPEPSTAGVAPLSNDEMKELEALRRKHGRRP